jgi:hypothetical protein
MQTRNRLMSDTYRQLAVEQVGDVWCLGLHRPRLGVGGLEELVADIDQFMAHTPCRNVVFSLGPEEPECLYSIFLAKLVTLQKRLRATGGALIIAQASEDVRKIFAACRLDDLFSFTPDRGDAIASLAQSSGA